MSNVYLWQYIVIGGLGFVAGLRFAIWVESNVG